MPGILSNSGLPSYSTSSVASLRLMAAVWGIWASSMASSASGVPATEVRTPPMSEAGGISEKLAGSSSAGTKLHGPSVDLDRYQRPDSSTYMLPVGRSRSQAVSVFWT